MRFRDAGDSRAALRKGQRGKLLCLYELIDYQNDQPYLKIIHSWNKVFYFFILANTHFFHFWL